MAEQTKVAVVVVTYNAMPYLDGCLGPLRDMAHPGLDVEVVVVDNASTDGTAGAVRRDHGWTTLVETGENLGFAGGNNVGIRRAMDGGAEFVFLLNQDTVPTEGFIAEAVKVARADERIAAVQSLLLLWPEKDLINSAGNAIHFLGFGYCTDYRVPVGRWRHSGVPEIAYASGAAVLLRASALERAGLFDEELFLYHEDLDLGWRLRLAGFSNVLAPHSVVHHKYEFSRSIGKYYYMERNRWIVLLKNCRLWTLIVLLPGLLAAEAGLALSAARGGWWPKKLAASLYFLRPRAWAHIFAERDRVARIREVGDREIVRLFTPAIRDQETPSPFVRFAANPLMALAWGVMRLLIV